MVIRDGFLSKSQLKIINRSCFKFYVSISYFIFSICLNVDDLGNLFKVNNEDTRTTSTKRLHILKQTCSLELQVCLTMCNLLVGRCSGCSLSLTVNRFHTLYVFIIDFKVNSIKGGSESGTSFFIIFLNTQVLLFTTRFKTRISCARREGVT